jgi:hypothetical protein
LIERYSDRKTNGGNPETLEFTLETILDHWEELEGSVPRTVYWLPFYGGVPLFFTNHMIWKCHYIIKNIYGNRWSRSNMAIRKNLGTRMVP